MKLTNLIRKELLNNGVYCIVNTINNKKYIGSCAAKDFLYTRLLHHYRDLTNHKHCNCILQAAWDKYGAECFDIIILEICLPENCLIKEQYYIDLLKPEYNIVKIAGNTLGRNFSDETKQKMRQIQLERYKKNPELRKFMSNVQKGKKRSKESIEKRRIKQLGKKQSEETKKKISIAHQGKKKRGKKVICQKLNKIFLSISETASFFNTTYNIIKRMLDKDINKLDIKYAIN